MQLKLNEKSAAFGLVIGSVLLGLGSVIVANLSVGAYAVAFWRLAVAALIFSALLRRAKVSLPKSAAARKNALISGIFLALDLALWHESIYAVGPGIST